MAEINFLELNTLTVALLFLVGFIGGMVSGFIGSGGAFVLTPAMMSLGAPAIVAVASNMAHKFPKALVGSIKRAKYGQVDVKLGVIMGIFAEVGVFVGKGVMTDIRVKFGDTGTDLYVSVVFIVVLAIVGGFVLRDAWRSRHDDTDSLAEHKTPRLARWVQSINIPGTMVSFRALNNKKVSVLFIAPLGFATGMLAASIAVGGFIGVPAMIYVLGVPALMASATELVVAFVMGMGGSLFYAWDGFVDIRLSLIILAGSLFGVQLGAIGTTYVKDYMVKMIMGSIMIIVLFSRFFKLPVYLSDMQIIATISATTANLLSNISFATLALALLFGAASILFALFTGINKDKKERAVLAASQAAELERERKEKAALAVALADA
ncbi:MAG: sulfite exporter TauE/SafE family protein [Gammaproteobacteria bacterium]|nr:sulfite exporter TauE/SafE family protein [Gammaproteobacteria bacterium]MDH5654059.1 sulfite exporter TauE/SafE family protein [Gammaproteobacteria bacterium]